jgi:hypothetical protein
MNDLVAVNIVIYLAHCQIPYLLTDEIVVNCSLLWTLSMYQALAKVQGRGGFSGFIWRNAVGSCSTQW